MNLPVSHHTERKTAYINMNIQSVLIFLLVTVFLFVSNSLLAQQKVLTYDDAIRIAIEQNIEVKQQMNMMKVSRVNQQQSMANFLPGVRINGSASRQNGWQWSNEESEMTNTSIDRTNYNIGADMTIFNGLRNVYSLKQSHQLHVAQGEQVVQSVQDVIFEVSQQYLEVLLDMELIKIAEKDVEVQKKLYDQVEAYKNVGRSTSSELLTQEARLKKSEVNVISLQNKLRSDKAGLAKILLLEPHEEFDIISPSWDIDSILANNYHPDTLIKSALDNKPDIRRLKAEEKAALHGIGISKSAYLPKLSLFYNYGSDYASDNLRLNPADNSYYHINFEDQLFNNNNFHQYGIALEIPIFNRLQTRTSVVRSKINYENSKLSYQDYEIQLMLDIQNACQDFTAYKESYLAYVISADVSQQAYQKQLERYQLGQGSLIELSIENQRNIQSQSEKAQAEYILIFQQVVLDYYTGRLSANGFD